MAFYRQLLVLTVPSVAVLFGIYWYRRKRGCANSDPGGNTRNIKTLKEELEEATTVPAAEAKCAPSPAKVIPKSAPIDIVSNGIHSQRASPIRLTDKQLDYEIEKAKSHKFFDMEHPVKKSPKENTPPGERRGKSLPAKGNMSRSTKPAEEGALNKSYSGKREANTSSLTEKLLISKVNEEARTSPLRAGRKLSDSTVSSVSPVREEIRKVEETRVECSIPQVECVPQEVQEQEQVEVDAPECSSNNNRAEVQEEIRKQASPLLAECPSAQCGTVDKPTTKSSRKCHKSRDNNIEQKAETRVQSAAAVPSVGNQQEEQCEKCVKVEDTSNSVTDTHSVDTDTAAPVVLETRSADRDSANHSPADAMLASPCISNFSDNHSEGSNDSGKGCSESPSPPPTSVGEQPAPADVFVRHQFVLPQSVVGLVIGNKRSFLNKMNETTCAKVYIRTHPDTPKLKICAIEGSQHDVDIVLDMIRQRLPEKRFPNISLKDITQELCEKEFSLMSDCYNLNLVEGVNNDTIVSCYVSPSQVFLQQPTHPTYPSLHILHTLMGVCYQDPSVPTLPQEVAEGMICAAPTANNWYRTQVISTNLEQNTSLLKLVDFGGFMNVNNSLLKQIRSDFMMLPFQATEVQLADIEPVDGEWSPEAVQVMAGLTSGQLLQAQVVGYNEEGLPQVYLYLTLGPQQVISLNQELVVRRLAGWTEQES